MTTEIPDKIFARRIAFSGIEKVIIRPSDKSDVTFSIHIDKGGSPYGSVGTLVKSEVRELVTTGVLRLKNATYEIVKQSP